MLLAQRQLRDGVVGAAYLESDGYLDPSQLCYSLAAGARAQGVRIHTHTSGAVLTAQQPMVNLIRTTLHAFGAALAGTQAMEVSAYDEALAIPTEDAATLALRVQQVIQDGTALGPLPGDEVNAIGGKQSN